MLRIDHEIKEILKRIGIVLLLIFLFILIHVQDIKISYEKQLKENRITNLEIKLQNQMNCIDSLVSDVDNLKEVEK